MHMHINAPRNLMTMSVVLALVLLAGAKEPVFPEQPSPMIRQRQETLETFRLLERDIRFHAVPREARDINGNTNVPFFQPPAEETVNAQALIWPQDRDPLDVLLRRARALADDLKGDVAKEGDDDYEYYQKNAEERKAMGKAFRERGAQRRANEKDAYDNIDKFAEKHALEAAEKEAFIGFVNELYNDLSDLKISMTTLEKLYKAMTYDEAVAEAAETAAIDGKNQAIEAARVKKAEAAAGDGVPAPTGGSAPAPQKPKSKPTFFDDIPKRKFQ